ncbi:MAG: ArnT family glycosyltransferase [Candidatus Eiseniibacteriota bacterium]
MDCDGAGYLEVARHLAAGRGFVTDAHRFLFLPVPGFPHADAHWSPLYPLLTALSFLVFGESFTAAKLVPLAFGIAVPPLVYLFANALTEDRRAALIAGLLVALHPTLVTWSLRIETEIATVALVVAVLTLALTVRGRAGALALGGVLGLAWLMKYQSSALVPPVLLALFLRMPSREAIRLSVLVLGAFAVTISLWLVRNAVAFNDFFYTDLRFNLLSYYSAFGGEPRYLSSLEKPPDALSWLASHPREVLAHARGSIHYLRLELAEARVVSPILLLLAAVGLVALARRWRQALPLVLYAAILGAVFAITVPQARYLWTLIPLALTAAGAGGAWLLERAGASSKAVRPARRAITVGLVALAIVAAAIIEVRDTIALARDRKAEWNPAAAFCPLEVEAARSWIDANVGPRTPVLATEVYHAAYEFRRPVIQVPFDDSTLYVVRGNFGAETMVISERELKRRLPHWETSPPEWAHRVATIPEDSVRARTGALWYEPVTDVYIYRLSRAADPMYPTGFGLRD